MDATSPKINVDKKIQLKNARHPLIDKNKVVPISLELGKDFSILLITGPNTGGKTVTLKTVGLLTCMACSGLNIPCSENSSIYVFDNIFADIGDDQSISDSLSTFSSHMLNIVEIIKSATKNSLILVDELGSGTDPLEGSNLAISILDYLKSIDSLVIATTHYQELKQYALVTNEFENASVEFDISTLSPTYKLLVGIPGKSNAFEISKKLGLDEKIIEKAKSFMNSNQIDIENLLKSIYDDKSLIEKEKVEISEKLEKINNLEKSLEIKNEKMKQQEKNLITNAKIEARNILLEAKEDATEIIRNMKKVSSNAQLNNSQLDNLRNKLSRKIKDIKLETEVSSNLSSDAEKLLPEDVKPNMEVFVTTLNKVGTVLSRVSKSNEVQVQIGSIKMNVPISNLSKIDKTSEVNNFSKSNISNKFNSTSNYNYSKNDITKNSFSNKSDYTRISKSKNIKTEINVIGLNVEEATFVVDKFLDDCVLAKLQTARIVHGKGTGTLRDGIHRFLKTHPHVKSFRIGTYGEGEMGVTIVEFKD